MSLNSQQFTTRNNSVQIKGVNEIHVSSHVSHSDKAFENKMNELKDLVQQMIVVGKAQATQQLQTPPRLCGICTSSDHPTDTCPILQDDKPTELPPAYAAALYNQSNNQNRYNIPDLSTNKYHPSWRNHPNLRYGNSQTSQQPNPSACSSSGC